MRILLMAGGCGTRLWPLSTEERPKQFLPLLSEKSLLAETFARLEPLSRDVWVAGSSRHAALLSRELPAMPSDRILAEPARRNSGPPILAAAVRFVRDGDPVTAAVPTDQTVGDAEAFRGALVSAAAEADRASVVILAVPPTRAETDFGYIETENGAVRRFIEKPDAARAREYASSGRHLWNAGIFVFRPSRLLTEARRVAPALLGGVERYVASGAVADFEALPNISFDYAVMEKASGVRSVPLNAGWSDVGTWRSVRDLRGGGDPSGNLVLSPVPVLAPGVSETAIVAGPEGVLVLPLERESELKASVEKLREREEPATRSRSKETRNTP
jgi:mannose-1-phosphate guanylyltransferase